MQQVAICPDCNSHLSLPERTVNTDGSHLATCPVCAGDFTLTIDRLSVLPVVQLSANASIAESKEESLESEESLTPALSAAETSSSEAASSPAPTSDATQPFLPSLDASSSASDASSQETSVDSADEFKASESLPTLAELLDRRSTTSDEPTPEAEPESLSVRDDSNINDALDNTESLAQRLSEVADLMQTVQAERDEQDIATPPAENQAADIELDLELTAFESEPVEPSTTEPVSEAPDDLLSLESMEPEQATDEPLANDFTFDFSVAVSESESPSSATADDVSPLVVDLPDDRRLLGVLRKPLFMVAGVVPGLAVGYYLLLLMGGPGHDTLSVASVLPNALLPASFDQPMEKPPMETSPPAPAEPLPIADALPAANALSAQERPVPPPAESASGSTAQDSITQDSATQDSATLPASFNEPLPSTAPSAAAPANPRVLWARLSGASPLGVDRLNGALNGSGDAIRTLGEHRLAEPEQIESIGLAYAQLCELAQVVSLLDNDSSHPDMLLQRLEAEDVYTKLFRSNHVRSDSKKIAFRWLAWPGRPHGGVFFSGTPTGPPQAAGDGLFRYDFELRDGSVTPVITSRKIDPERFVKKQSDEMLVIGSVVDSPNKRLQGYQGDADRVVWGATTIALEAADLP